MPLLVLSMKSLFKPRSQRFSPWSSSGSLYLYFISINFYDWCNIGTKVHFLLMDVELLQYCLLRGNSFLHWTTLAPLCTNTDTCVNSIFWFSVLFHWPICLSFHQYYNDLITTAMFCSFFSSVWFKTFKSVNDIWFSSHCAN